MLETFTEKELQRLERPRLNQLARRFGLSFLKTRTLLIHELLEIQGDVLARAYRTEKNLIRTTLAETLLELAALRGRIEEQEREITALREWITELDDDAVRVRLEAHGVISPGEMLSYSRSVLYRICESLRLTYGEKDRKQALVQRIHRKLREMGLAHRTLDEIESSALDSKRETELALYRSLAEGRTRPPDKTED